MNTVWKKRIGRIVSNFGISFLTPFLGSGVGESIYRNTIDINLMLFTAFFSSIIYTALVILQELQELSNDRRK